MNHLDWDDVAVFLAVAERGSLRGAARQLGISQPTAGRRVQALERDLESALFDRLPEGHQLTAAGEALLPHAEAMREAADAIRREVDGSLVEPEGRVRVATGDSTGRFLASRIDRLAALAPGIDWDLAESHLLVSLSRREADLALRDVRPETGDLVVSKHGTMAYAVYGARDYVDRTPEARGRRRFARCDWVGYEEAHAFLPSARWLRERGVGRLRMGFSNAGSIHRAIAAGAGLGVLPCFAGDVDARLVRLGAPIRELAADLWIVIHRDLRRRASVRTAAETLARLLAEEKAALSGR